MRKTILATEWSMIRSSKIISASMLESNEFYRHFAW
jgi:hypothetical protein